jgi:hypothetical protein
MYSCPDGQGPLRERLNMSNEIKNNPIGFCLRTIKNSGKVPFLVHGQRVSISGNRRFLQDASVFTAVGFALEHGFCPVECVREQMERQKKEPWGDHRLRAFLLEGVMLTDQPQTEIARVELALGQVVSIEGCICRIESAANYNFEAVELTEQEIRDLSEQLKEAA